MSEKSSILNTLAFSETKIESLNDAIKAIDDRFFLFSDYRLHVLSNTECFKHVFTTAMINLYNIIYDCGPMNLFENFHRFNKSFKNNTNFKNFQKFLKFIKDFRIQYCHNYNSVYSLDDILLKKVDVSFNFYNIKYYNCDDDAIQIENLTLLLEKFYANIYSFLLYVKNNKKSDFISGYLHMMSHWYTVNEKFLLSVISDKYILFNNDESYVTRDKAKDWIKYSNAKFDCYNEYMSACSKRIDNLFNNKKDCPRPAYPLDFFNLITFDLDVQP